MMNTEQYGESSASEILEARYTLASHFFGFDLLPVLKSAVQLTIPETIQKHGKPMPLSDLVAALHIDPTKSRSLHHLMRVLIHYGYFSVHHDDGAGEEEQQVKYSLTPLCALLLKDNQFRPSSDLWKKSDPELKVKALYALGDWFQSNDPTPFVTAFGRTVWDSMKEESSRSKNLDGEMASDSELITSILVDKHRAVFEGLESLVDVGGAAATLAKGISGAFPSLKCTVLDRPDVVANLTGGHGNVDYVGGDMFLEIPRGDAILLKWVLHNWGDEDCVKILRKCRDAIINNDKAGGGKLIVIEMVIMENGTNAEDKYAKGLKLFFDICMISFFNGKERTEKEFAKLFADAGFSRHKIVPITSLMSLIEVYP